MSAADPADSRVVLSLTRAGRDAALTHDILGEAGMQAREVSDVSALCAAIRAGAGAALVSEEYLNPPAIRALAVVLAEQPPWSDFPIVIFGASVGERSAASLETLVGLGNVTLLERPVHVRTVVAAVRAALRSRGRQYESRRAIAARDQFLAMLGHELRNPLAAARLAADLLVRQGVTGRHIESLDRQIRTLTRMLDDLLDVARVTTGKIVLRLEEVDLCDVVRSCMNQQQETAAAQGLAMRATLPQQPVTVQGDRVRLEQVVANLVVNAIKYTPRGGAVDVKVERDGARGVVRVKDTGLGIAPAMQERIFEVFAQVDGSLARAQGGLGLGLPVVRSLVRMHGGSVAVRSEGLGQGSEFCVSLPLAAARREGRAPEPAPSSHHAPRRVVIVEDNDDIRANEADLLVAAGHAVHTANDGPAGAQLILRERPDVAFIDLGLPGFDGLEVARRVRNALGEGIRLIAVTGYGQPEDRRAVAAAGFDSHLTKPVGLAELEGAMDGAG